MYVSLHYFFLNFKAIFYFKTNTIYFRIVTVKKMGNREKDKEGNVILSKFWHIFLFPSFLLFSFFPVLKKCSFYCVSVPILRVGNSRSKQSRSNPFPHGWNRCMNTWIRFFNRVPLTFSRTCVAFIFLFHFDVFTLNNSSLCVY